MCMARSLTRLRLGKHSNWRTTRRFVNWQLKLIEGKSVFKFGRFVVIAAKRRNKKLGMESIHQLSAQWWAAVASLPRQTRPKARYHVIMSQLHC